MSVLCVDKYNTSVRLMSLVEIEIIMSECFCPVIPETVFGGINGYEFELLLRTRLLIGLVGSNLSADKVDLLVKVVRWFYIN